VIGPSEAAFEVIENGAITQDLRIRDSDVTLTGGSVRHAIDRLGRRHLLVPLAADEPAAEDHGSCGVSLAGRELLDKGHQERYQDVVCESADLNDLFAVFCDDLLTKLAIKADQPAVVCSHALERWRALFNPSRGAMLGPEALAGLLAELHVLELIAARAPSGAVALWTGPDQARADFSSATAAIEVKATTRREGVIVAIHGLRQLEEPQSADLYLFVEQFEITRNGQDSVPDAVARLLSSGVDRVGLLTGLNAVGYQDMNAAAYRLIRFDTSSRRTFRVTEAGFPRLVPTSLTDPNLADKIFRVSYLIDVTNAMAIPGNLITIEPALDHLLGNMTCRD
jgi:hypothetical protein